MKRYDVGAQLWFEQIPDELQLQEKHLKDKWNELIREMRCIKVPDTEIVYNLYYLKSGVDIPSLRGFNFFGAGKKEELSDLFVELQEKHTKYSREYCRIKYAVPENFPEEIRIIRPNDKDYFGVFVKGERK